MHDVSEFVAGYTEVDRARIAFDWNGKHAAEFKDANQDFRWTVVGQCLASPEVASPLLLEHLFLEDAEWSRQAWCAPNHFAQLGGALLSQGAEAALEPFSRGFVTSFDTFGACHSVELPADLNARLALHAQRALAASHSEEQRRPLEATVELLDKLKAGTSREGWLEIAPGSPATNIRVVSRHWYQGVWSKVSSFWRGWAT